MTVAPRTLAAAAALLACLLALPGPAAAQAGERPNVVLILTDDQRWDTLQHMPNVQSELVSHGVTFANGFVTNPRCCPSRASILTGAYSHTTRVYQNDGWLGGFKAFRDASTVATWLDGVGYETALVGKYLNQYPGTHVPPGWDRWVAFISPVGFYRYGFDEDGETSPVAERSTYSTDFLAEEAVSFIQTAPRPFFLYVAPFAPHAPATPAERHESAFSALPAWRPPSYNELDVSDKPAWLRALPTLDAARSAALDAFRAQQLRSLLAVDEAVAEIVQALSESGELENTLIVFTSDNGLAWGEHRWRGGKRVPYEESIRVPFVVRYDRLVATARTDARPVLNIDLAPTFAALAGAWAPGAEGRSFLPLLAGGRVPWRTRFLVEHLRRNPPTYCALRAPRYSFVTYATGERELYDLVRDPYQLTNVAGRPASGRTVAVLRKQLARLCKPPPPGLPRHLLCTRKGTGSADVLRGTNGYDILCGGRGNDRLYPRKGKDWVYAGPGRDVIGARDGFADVISCGKGHDVVRVDSRDRARNDCERVKRG